MAPVLGTAHLFALVPPERSEALLLTALEAGFRSIDTAPSYGFGRSEDAVGRALRAAGLQPGDVDITTKVGIAPTPEPGTATRLAKAAARRLPAPVQRRLRGAAGGGDPDGGDPDGGAPDGGARPAEQGRFGVDEVRASVEQSLRRLGHIDRLLLHEVRPDDLGEELLSRLEGYVAAGDVGGLGVATTNARTAACVARAPDLLRAVNISVAPSADPVHLPASVTRRVGHGVFGAGGADLRRAQARLRADPVLAATWQAASVGTAWGDPQGLSDAMLVRAAQAAGVDAVIIATSRPDRLVRAHALLADGAELPGRLAELLTTVCDDSVLT